MHTPIRNVSRGPELDIAGNGRQDDSSIHVFMCTYVVVVCSMEAVLLGYLLVVVPWFQLNLV